MNMEQAANYLRCKSDALQRVDKEQGRQESMKQFLDKKSLGRAWAPTKENTKKGREKWLRGLQN